MLGAASFPSSEAFTQGWEKRILHQSCFAGGLKKCFSTAVACLHCAGVSLRLSEPINRNFTLKVKQRFFFLVAVPLPLLWNTRRYSVLTLRIYDLKMNIR